MLIPLNVHFQIEMLKKAFISTEIVLKLLHKSRNSSSASHKVFKMRKKYLLSGYCTYRSKDAIRQGADGDNDAIQ